MITLVLPSLVAGRDLADEFVDRLAGTLAGQVVTVDARRLTRGTPSFAARLVERVLGDGAQRLVVQGPPALFAGYLEKAAGELGDIARLDVRGVADHPAAI